MIGDKICETMICAQGGKILESLLLIVESKLVSHNCPTKLQDVPCNTRFLRCQPYILQYTDHLFVCLVDFVSILILLSFLHFFVGHVFH